VTGVSLAVAAYFAGSIPFGLLLTRWLRGADVRAQGSGNIGATNVARVAGKKVGAVVLLLDALKGAIPAALARWLFPDDAFVQATVGLAAVLGHVFSLWLKLRGGKGVATALGVFAVLLPLPALAGGAVFAAVFALTRVSALGSLSAALTVAGVAWAAHAPPDLVKLAAFLFALLVFTHRGNLKRLVNRTENKL
jgi:glycerol-3-phosphate acyltransferase PlsY